MLHLARRIALGGQVGDLLELQSPFERHGIRDTAPQEERAPGILEDPDGLLHPVPEQPERLLDLLRRQPEAASDLPQFLSGMAPRMPASASASRSSTATWATNALVEATQISGPAFVSKTASASRVMSDPLVLVTASTLAPKPLRRLNGRQGIRGLPALAYGDDQRTLVPDRVRVTILAGDRDLDGYPGELLYGVFAQQAGVVGRATGDDHDPVYLGEVELLPRRGRRRRLSRGGRGASRRERPAARGSP